MLWYKGWLETRFRLLYMLGFGLFFIIVATRNANSTPLAVERLLTNLAFYWPVGSVMLAGAGIKTQAAFQATKGLHGSMHFTLSLPVSRFRLLAVRAGLGLLETVGIITGVSCAVWVMFPPLRTHFTPLDAVEYFLAVTICVSAFCSLSVLLATFLDDMWQIWTSLIAVISLRWLSSAVRVPPYLDIFRAMGQSSPLFTHTLPWASMGISLAIAAAMFFVALKVVQAREY